MTARRRPDRPAELDWVQEPLHFPDDDFEPGWWWRRGTRRTRAEHCFDDQAEVLAAQGWLDAQGVLFSDEELGLCGGTP